MRIRETERDALRFHWIVDKHSKEVEMLRFTRVLFGLASSPFLLGGVIQQHLETWKTRLPESVSEVLKNLYVNDHITGVPTIPATKRLKCDAPSSSCTNGTPMNRNLKLTVRTTSLPLPNSNLAAHPRLGKASSLESPGTKAKTP